MTYLADFQYARYCLLICLALWAHPAWSDQWEPLPRKLTETTIAFGDTRFVMSVDARTSQDFPTVWMDIYRKRELLARYPGVLFEKIYPSPDNSYFLGLSNSGLPGVAVGLFDAQGALQLFAQHGIASFDYCKRTTSLVARWYDEDDPQVTFTMNRAYNKALETVTLRDCHGKTIDLFQAIAGAYNQTLQRSREDASR